MECVCERGAPLDEDEHRPQTWPMRKLLGEPVALNDTRL